METILVVETEIQSDISGFRTNTKVWGPFPSESKANEFIGIRLKFCPNSNFLLYIPMNPTIMADYEA